MKQNEITISVTGINYKKLTHSQRTEIRHNIYQTLNDADIVVSNICISEVEK